MATHLDSTDLNILLLALDNYAGAVAHTGGKRARVAQLALIDAARVKVEAAMSRAFDAETLAANS